MVGAIEMVKKSKLYGLHEALDWSKIEKHLIGLYQREISGAGGQIPYAPLSMFKAMLLGQWHELSDEELERSLQTRIDYMVFTGFELGEDFPDSSTLCRFRGRLEKNQKNQVLLQEINRQLEALGLKIKTERGAIIDATIIPSAAHPKGKKPLEISINELNELSDKHENIIKKQEFNKKIDEKETMSADKEARWLMKGKRAYFGYRGYAVVDTEDGFIEHVTMKPANENETNQFQSVISDTLKIAKNITKILADKGYTSKENSEFLKKNGLENQIMARAYKSKPLTEAEIIRNKFISKTRYKVERCFGSLKRQWGISRARYFGVRKTLMQFTWAAIGYNLLKAHRILTRFN